MKLANRSIPSEASTVSTASIFLSFFLIYRRALFALNQSEAQFTKLGRYSQNMLSEAFLDPEHSFVAVWQIHWSMFTKQKFNQLITKYFTKLFSGWTKQKFAQLRMGSRHLNLTGLYPLRVSSISASVAEAIFCFSEISSDSTLLDDKISMADSSSKMLPWKQNSLVTSNCILYNNMLNIQRLVFYPSMYAQLLTELYDFSECCQHHASLHVHTGGIYSFKYITST